MKGWIIIIIFIVLLTVAGILEQSFITNSFETLKDDTLNFQETIESTETLNTTDILEEFTTLQTTWEKDEKTLCLFINHQHMEEVNQELHTIEIALNYNDKQTVLTSINLILNFVNGYRDFAVISWESIF